MRSHSAAPALTSHTHTHTLLTPPSPLLTAAWITTPPGSLLDGTASKPMLDIWSGKGAHNPVWERA